MRPMIFHSHTEAAKFLNHAIWTYPHAWIDYVQGECVVCVSHPNIEGSFVFCTDHKYYRISKIYGHELTA